MRSTKPEGTRLNTPTQRVKVAKETINAIIGPLKEVQRISDTIASYAAWDTGINEDLGISKDADKAKMKAKIGF